jgi:RNA 2',3'-cyclic 3'-phosphodiesterase
VKSPASVDGDARLRLFLALQLPDDVVRTLVEWQARALSASAERRIVPPGNLHVTLAFLGHRPAAELPAILRVLEEAAGEASSPLLELVRWRETRSVGMLELLDRTGSGAKLAGRLHEALEELGVYRRENRPWLPHVTVLRHRERPRLRTALPELEPFAPSGAAAYLSRLHPSGARYDVLQSFRLGG